MMLLANLEHMAQGCSRSLDCNSVYYNDDLVILIEDLMKPARLNIRKFQDESHTSANDENFSIEDAREELQIDPELQIQNLYYLLDKYHESMVYADLDYLKRLLDRSFFLVHITGYKQPRHEWFQVIKNRDFDYHRIQLHNGKPQIQILKNGWQAIIKGIGTFDATIHGMKNPWKLEFVINLEKRNNEWKFISAEYNSASPGVYF